MDLAFPPLSISTQHPILLLRTPAFWLNWYSKLTSVVLAMLSTPLPPSHPPSPTPWWGQNPTSHGLFGVFLYLCHRLWNKSPKLEVSMKSSWRSSQLTRYAPKGQLEVIVAIYFTGVDITALRWNEISLGRNGADVQVKTNPAEKLLACPLRLLPHNVPVDHLSFVAAPLLFTAPSPFFVIFCRLPLFFFPAAIQRLLYSHHNWSRRSACC